MARRGAAICLLAIAVRFLPAMAEGRVVFVDVTTESGISFRHVNGLSAERNFIETMGPGCAFVDYDSDGYLDLYLVNGHGLSGSAPDGAANALYRNGGNGRFRDVTAQAAVGDTGYGMGVAAGDYDNDGDVDLYITNYGPNKLYRNNGDGTFADATQSAGVGEEHWGVGCAFLDYDGDGLLDLYVANYVDFVLGGNQQAVVPYMPAGAGRKALRDVRAYPHPGGFNGVPDVLYRNRGDGTFVDVSRQAGVDNSSGKGMGMACSDYDNDGDVDVYVANDLTPNFLYQNGGDGTFTDVALVAGVAYSENGDPESSMGVDFGDYDRDGNMDLVVPNFQGEATSLYHNSGDGFFTEESARTGLGVATRPFVGWGVGFLDYDNNGELDLFIATGHVLDNVDLFDGSTSYRQRNFLLRNVVEPGGSHAFVDVTSVSGSGLSVVKASRGVALGDYDNDGDTDILVANCNDSPTLLRNDGGSGGCWLRVELEGTRSNRSAIGARVEVVSGDLDQIREVKSGASLYSQSDLRLLFGLGRRLRAEVVSVRWPSGAADTLRDVAANQALWIREGVGLVEMGAGSR